MGKEENEVQAACLKLFHSMGWVAWRQNNLRVRGRPFRGMRGLSDIQALEPLGPSWFVECKSPGEVQSPDQITFQSGVERSDHIYLCVDHVDQLIEKLKYENHLV